MSGKEKELSEEQLKKASGGRDVGKQKELSEEELGEAQGGRRSFHRGEEPGGDQLERGEADEE